MIRLARRSARDLGADNEQTADREADLPTPSDLNDEPGDANATPQTPSRRRQAAAVMVFAVLPAVAILMAGAAGYLRWTAGSVHASTDASQQAVHVATERTIEMLSYEPDTVDKELTQARDGLTGTFKDSYTQLTNDVVIPGAKEKRITAAATVPAASSISASAEHAVVMLFVNQSITVGDDPPTNSASAVRVTLDKINDRWLVSDFTPI